MAKLVFGMNQSLDGYVDHMAFAPSPTLFRHFIEEAKRQVSGAKGEQGGAVTVGAIPTVAPFLLPSLASAFRRRHPGTRVVIFSSTSTSSTSSAAPSWETGSAASPTACASTRSTTP